MPKRGFFTQVLSVKENILSTPYFKLGNTFHVQVKELFLHFQKFNGIFNKTHVVMN